MKKSIVFILLTSLTLFATSAEKLFDSNCVSCHSKTIPKDKSNIVAPALFGVMKHIKMNFDNKSEALIFMNDYIMNPSKDKSLCMPSKIDKFGLMPSQKNNVTQKELKTITSWMYDNFPPKSFKGGGMNVR